MIAATRLLALAEPHIGEPYVLGCDVPLTDPAWTGPWDCAEWVSWVVAQATGRVLGVTDPRAANPEPYTGAWFELADDAPTAPAGERVAAGQVLRLEVADALRIPGAILVRCPQPGADGHIVLVGRDGSTIEAYNTAKGVIRGNAIGRRWDVGCLVPGVEYVRDAPIVSRPPARVLRRGSRGRDVEELQRALGAHGFPAAVDGRFGDRTTRAVVAFQRSRGLVADGEVGPLTWAALRTV